MSGLLLSDAEILAAITNDELKVSGLVVDQIDLSNKDCPIQPSSLDLHVGEIFIPPEKKFDLDREKPQSPKSVKGAKIAPGHSAFVETREALELGSQISAFGFPPAHLARSALLMTNPGHIDPGFKGKLTFTIINLGRDDIQIDVDTIIATFLIFRFPNETVAHNYSKRRLEIPQQSDSPGNHRAAILNTLSPDFGNLSSRLSTAALKAVEEQTVQLSWAKLWLPALTGAVTVLAIWASSLFPSLDAIASDEELEQQISSTKSQIEREISSITTYILDMKTRLDELERKNAILDFDERLDALKDEVGNIKKNE